MAITLDGFPKVVVQAKDISILPTTSSRGVYCVQIATQRGEINKCVYVSSTTDYRRKFGKWVTGMTGVYELEAALDGTAKAYVSRVGHYTDVSDTSTLQGTESTGTLTVNSVAETRASGSIVIAAAGVDGNTIELVANNGLSIITIATYEVETGDDTSDVAAGLRASMTSLATGYTPGGATATVSFQAPIGTGAAANSYTIGKNVTGTVDGNITQMSGGVTAIAGSEAGVAVWEGKAIGPGYDGTVIGTTLNALDSTKVDLTITLADGTKSPQRLTTNRVLSAPEIALLNTKLEDIKLTSLTTRFPIGTVTLTGGVYNTGLLTDNDYIGDQTAKTGVWSFVTAGGNGLPAPNRIANIERLSHAVDSAYSLYVTKKIFLRAFLAIPIGLTYQQAFEYRNRTGAYASGTMIDNFQCRYIYSGGGLKIYDPQDSTQEITLSGIGHVMGLRAVTDTKGAYWLSDAGEGFGQISGTKGVVGNLAQESEDGGYADLLYKSGVNAIIDHERFGITYWGNKTTLRDQSKLLSKDNIAELMIYIMIKMKEFADKKLFKANSPSSWSKLYQEVKQFADELAKKDAFAGKENEGWWWMGDQFADSVNGVTFNTKADINSGIYRCQFLFVPIAATELIGIEVTSSDSNSVQFAIATAA